MAKKFEKVGRVSSSSVEKGSGRGWEEWIRLLEKAGARDWTHKEIVAYLRKKYEVGPWWEQGVTLGFEIATGRRIDGQNQKGEYTVTATRTLHVKAPAVWKRLVSPDGIAAWLNPMSEFKLKPKQMFEREGGVFGEVRTMLTGQRVRMTWQETEWPKPTVFQIGLNGRPNGTTILYVSHDGLKSVAQREAMRRYWKAALESFADLLLGQS